jgi:hypothetical protein
MIDLNTETGDFLEQQLKASNDIYVRAYEAGHKDGYLIGYKEATAKALEVINKAFENRPSVQA